MSRCLSDAISERTVRAATRLLAICCATGALLSTGCGDRSQTPAEDTGIIADGDRTLPINLYFPAEDGRLHAESRTIVPTADTETRIRQLVESLLAGPQDEQLVAPFPPEVVLDSIFINDTGVAFLDLKLDGSPHPPLDGSWQELLAVYSLVDSVLLNVPEVRSVAVLWNGQQRTSFAGHVDTSRPLVADSSYLAESP